MKALCLYMLLYILVFKTKLFKETTEQRKKYLYNLYLWLILLMCSVNFFFFNSKKSVT